MGKKQKTILNTFWKSIVDVFTPEQKEKIVPFVLKNEKCCFCGVSDAKWKHYLLNECVCNDCVPRGCSCTLKKIKGRTGLEIEDYEYLLDKHGNEIPCEDWKKI